MAMDLDEDLCWYSYLSFNSVIKFIEAYYTLKGKYMLKQSGYFIV